MATNKTENLQLNSWVGTDGVRREEINENFEKIDTEIGNVNSHLADIVTLKPNGVDDTTAIQNALSKFGFVKLGKGEFISSPFVIGNNQALVGEGIGLTTLKLKGGANGTFVNAHQANNSRIENLTLDGNKVNNTATGEQAVLLIDNTTDWELSSQRLVVRNVYIKNGANNGLSSLRDSANGKWNWVYLFDNITIEYCEGYGFYDLTTDNKYSNFYVSNNKKANIYLKSSSNIYVNFKTDYGGVTSSGDLSRTDGANIILESCSNIHFTNMDVQSGRHTGMKAFYIRDCILNMSFNYNSTGSPNPTWENPGVRFVGCKNTSGTISFPLFQETQAQKIDCIMDVNCENLSFHCATVDEKRIINNGKQCALIPISKLKKEFDDLKSIARFKATNLVTNGDFSNSTTGWIVNGGTISAINNILTVLGNGSSASMFTQNNTGVNFVTGHKYYSRAKIKFNEAVVDAYLGLTPGTSGSTFYNYFTPTVGVWESKSFVNTATDQNGSVVFRARSSYADAATQNGKSFNVQYAVVIDLTEVFGAGKEPTAAEMDDALSKLTNGWFNGTTSVYTNNLKITLMYILNQLGV
jgi:hypothetical protein